MQQAISDTVYTIPSSESAFKSNKVMNNNDERKSAFKPLKKSQSCQSINGSSSRSDTVYTIPTNECQFTSNKEIKSERNSAFKSLKKSQTCQSIIGSSSSCHSYSLSKPQTHETYHFQPYSYSGDQVHYNNNCEPEQYSYETTSDAPVQIYQQQQSNTAVDESTYMSHIQNLYTRSRPISLGNQTEF